MLIDVNVAVEGELDLVRIRSRREDEVIFHVAVRVVIYDVDPRIDIRVSNRAIVRNAGEPGLLRMPKKVVGVAAYWIDARALCRPGSDEFHMCVVAAEREDDFRPDDINRGPASLGHPFGAAFYLTHVGLEMDSRGAGHRCLWPAFGVSKSGRRQKTIVRPTGHSKAAPQTYAKEEIERAQTGRLSRPVCQLTGNRSIPVADRKRRTRSHCTTNVADLWLLIPPTLTRTSALAEDRPTGTVTLI